MPEFFAREASGARLEHFQAKRIPVRVKKIRKNKNLEPFHVSTKREKALAHIPEKWVRHSLTRTSGADKTMRQNKS
jgi:hypothetical protein